MSEAWQPIDTAPKDGTRILLAYSRGLAVCGAWDSDNYAKKPRPYWANDYQRSSSARAASPTHWMPIPPNNEGKTA